MKIIKLYISVLLLILSSTTGWSDTLTIDDLVIRKKIFYEKFTNNPFSGEISGIENGKFMDGIKNGLWTTYYKNGQLKFLGKYNVGKPDGIWETYYENGQLNEKV